MHSKNKWLVLNNLKRFWIRKPRRVARNPSPGHQDGDGAHHMDRKAAVSGLQWS